MAPSAPFRLLVPLVVALSACGGDEAAAERRPLGAAESGSGLPPAVQAQVDSGNAAYRAGDPQAALVHYRRATEIDPDVAAPWFGISMAAGAVGDQAAADSARARLRAIDPELAGGVHGAPGELPPDHPAVGAPASELPADHPPVSGTGGRLPSDHPQVPVSPSELPAGHP